MQDPTKRPTARSLLEHRFFKHVPKDRDYMRKHLIAGLPDVITRVQHMKDGVKGLPFEPALQAESRSNDEYVRGLSAWNFDVTELKRQVRPPRTSNAWLARIHSAETTSAPDAQHAPLQTTQRTGWWWGTSSRLRHLARR